jgi:hypothetical protein
MTHRLRRSGVLSVLLLLVIAVGAALASGTLSVGSVLSADSPPGAPEYRQAEETVLALGSDPQVGRWRITSYSSRELEDAGEVLQPAGLPCLKLLLSDASGRPVAGRSFCGARGADGFEAATLPVVGRSRRPLYLVFGTAPDSAATVELLADGREAQHARVHQGPSGFRRRAWMLVVPGDPPVHTATLGWREAEGGGYEDTLDVTLELRRSGTPIPIAEATPER